MKPKLEEQLRLLIREEVAKAIAQAYERGKDDVMNLLFDRYEWIAREEFHSAFSKENKPRLQKSEVARMFGAISLYYDVNAEIFAQAFGFEADGAFRNMASEARQSSPAQLTRMLGYKQVLISMFESLHENQQSEIWSAINKIQKNK